MAEIPTKTRREVEFETRRSFIVDTTRRLISTKDIDSTSMDDIAAAVQYTRRTLYAYFKSRDEIFLQVFAEDLGRRWAVQQRALAEAATGLEKIHLWAEALFQFSREHPSSVRLQAYWSYRGIDPSKISEHLFNDFRRLNDELAEALREIFRLGISDGTLRPDLDVDLCVSQFLYSLRAAIDRALSPAYSFAHFDSEEYVSHFLDLFTRSVRT
ncbi:MAG: TetR/AcrR family transcriptional regulator [bacterium]|nr:TetR/AcrR family transcriptional regulator [bacterium]